ncbi:MAG: hypothetical protein EXR82_10365 [Gammaproteobacteria bacterium]|nr:hypothetical protein [Gammaproteobacteria bacterium]
MAPGRRRASLRAAPDRARTDARGHRRGLRRDGCRRGARGDRVREAHEAGVRLEPCIYPAGPVLTTITDTGGFFLVLSLATLVLPRLTA